MIAYTAELAKCTLMWKWDSFDLWQNVCGTPSGSKECAAVQKQFSAKYSHPCPNLKRKFIHAIPGH